MELIMSITSSRICLLGFGAIFILIPTLFPIAYYIFIKKIGGNYAYLNEAIY